MVSVSFTLHAVASVAEEGFREATFTDDDPDEDALRELLLEAKFHSEGSVSSVPREEVVVLRICVVFQRKICFVVHNDAEVV